MGQRTYHSPLREEQARRTRARILDALIELMPEQGPAHLSVRDLARAAGVAERTVYRHFPDRAALLDGLAEHVGQRSQWLDFEADVDDIRAIPDAIPRSFRIYDAHHDALRALVLLNADPARTAAISRSNHAHLVRAIRRAFPRLRRSEVAEAAAVLHVLGSSRTWLRFREEFGLSSDQAGRAAATAARAVLGDLERRDAP